MSGIGESLHSDSSARASQEMLQGIAGGGNSGNNSSSSSSSPPPPPPAGGVAVIARPGHPLPSSRGRHLGRGILPARFIRGGQRDGNGSSNGGNGNNSRDGGNGARAAPSSKQVRVSELASFKSS